MPPRSRRTDAAVKAKTETPPEERKIDRAKATLAIVNKINRDKKYGPGTIVRATEIVTPERWRTGALAFDVAMSGGLPVNQWTEVVGNENSGKTTFILKALAANQKRDSEFFCVWVASETFDPDLADKCGVDRSRVYLIEENVMEVAFELALEFIEGRACDMLVIDSYPALTTQQEDAKTMEEHSMGGAKVLNLFMRKCTKATKRSLTDLEDRPFSGIIVNQWREKIGVLHGDPRTTPGGKGKNYWMYARLDVRRDEWIVNKQKEKVGQAIKIVCFKMKGARPQQVGVADFYFAEHGEFMPGDYDDFKQIVNLAILFDVIERSGSGYKGPEGQHLKSQQLLVDTLASDVEWRERVEREVLEIAGRGKAPVEVDADVVSIVEDEEEVPSAKPRSRRRGVNA